MWESEQTVKQHYVWPFDHFPNPWMCHEDRGRSLNQSIIASFDSKERERHLHSLLIYIWINTLNRLSCRLSFSHLQSSWTIDNSSPFFEPTSVSMRVTHHSLELSDWFNWPGPCMACLSGFWTSRLSTLNYRHQEELLEWGPCFFFYSNFQSNSLYFPSI